MECSGSCSAISGLWKVVAPFLRRMPLPAAATFSWRLDEREATALALLEILGSQLYNVKAVTCGRCCGDVIAWTALPDAADVLHILSAGHVLLDHMLGGHIRRLPTPPPLDAGGRISSDRALFGCQPCCRLPLAWPRGGPAETPVQLDTILAPLAFLELCCIRESAVRGLELGLRSWAFVERRAGGLVCAVSLGFEGALRG